MSSAVDGVTSHPLWVKFILAARLNNLLGGFVISPDEVELLTDEYLILMDAITDDSQVARAGMKHVRSIETEFLRRHGFKRR